MSESNRPVIHYERCERCGRCVRACPHQAITMGPNGPVIHCTPECAEQCTYQNDGFVCVGEEVCPNRVIAWEFEIVFDEDQQA